MQRYGTNKFQIYFPRVQRHDRALGVILTFIMAMLWNDRHLLGSFPNGIFKAWFSNCKSSIDRLVMRRSCSHGTNCSVSYSKQFLLSGMLDNDNEHSRIHYNKGMLIMKTKHSLLLFLNSAIYRRRESVPKLTLSTIWEMHVLGQPTQSRRYHYTFTNGLNRCLGKQPDSDDSDLFCLENITKFSSTQPRWGDPLVSCYQWRVRKWKNKKRWTSLRPFLEDLAGWLLS